jgi:hypothetical protein
MITNSDGMAPVCERMTSNAASCGVKKYCMAGEHMHITNLFLNNFIKIVSFLRNFCQLGQNSGLLDKQEVYLYEFYLNRRKKGADIPM